MSKVERKQSEKKKELKFNHLSNRKKLLRQSSNDESADRW